MFTETLSGISFTGRVKVYPDGGRELLASDRAVFHETGWEERDPAPRAARIVSKEKDPGSVRRAVRRARAQVRDLAFSNPMRYFVTLTLDRARVDRYDPAAVVRKLNAWCSNQVQRRGLKYVLVPEHHKDGAIHFHGFFNDALEAVDSGTVTMPGWKRPRRPRGPRERERWLSEGGHVVYNLPGWSLGYTTALELYGTYDRAVGYVCKYIGKEQAGGTPEKIGGRWYYSGGALERPKVQLADLDWRDLADRPGAYRFYVPEAGATFVVLREEGTGAGPQGAKAAPIAAQSDGGTGPGPGTATPDLTVSGL